MFAQKASTSVASLRNPRRRQRTSSGESIKPPDAKRQRSILHQDETFKTADLTERDPDYRSLEHPTAISPDEPNPTLTNDGGDFQTIPIRTAKKHEKRKGDPIKPIVLSKTDFYTVSQLPSLPDQIRNLQPGPSKCYFATCQRYGLVLTNMEAIIWPYSVLTSSPAPTEVFRLPLPESCRVNSDLAPLGVVLLTATSSIPGLMIVLPQDGRIIYWETVSCAASLGLPRQKQTGLQGTIPGMLSGEYATEIVNGEPSGVMITFSSGRVAHVTLRDSQGKPAVTVNFLKNPSINSGVGFFGGIKNVLGGGFWRKKVAAVCAGESYQRGQRDILIATSAGLVEVWDTHWNNGSILKRQFDTKENLRTSLAVHNLDINDDYEIRVWDLTFSAQKQNRHDAREDSGQSWQIAVLVSLFSGSNLCGVFVVQLKLSESIHVVSTNPLNPQTLPTGVDELRPRLFIPGTGETAFIVLGQSVVLLSLVGSRPSPSSQLLIDNGQPQSFCDSINFRSEKEYEIIGTGSEDASDGVACPACLVMIRDFGVIRISALPRQEVAGTTEPSQITARHKIEQAVFYGTLLGSPLNLSSKGDLNFPITEIEDATQEICRGVLRSSSKFIPTTAISIDQNLKLRAKAVDDLCRLLLEQNKILDRRIWWELLWAAEKIAAQRAIWKLEEVARRSKSSGRTFLAHVLGAMSDKFKTKPEQQGNGNDHVRHWFLYDTYRMEHIVPWIYHVIKPQKGNASKQLRRMSEHILEASELSLAVLETAFKYRDEHASRFGIGDGYLEEGVLITGYEGLPEFWTSYSISYAETGHLLEIELESCRAWIQTSGNSEKFEQQHIGKIARNSARHLRILGQMYSERTRWLSAQGDQKLLDEAISIRDSHTKHQRWHLFKLAGIGQLDDAINIAESFRDMTALVELIIELQDQSKSLLFVQEVREDTSSGSQTASKELETKITQYFEKFGDAWADAFFARQISMGQSGILFSMAKFQPFVTRFLHKNPAYSKLSWVNDVVGDTDYESAAKTLENLALDQEHDIWSHRVELSLAKLANLATYEKRGSSDSQTAQASVKRLEDLAEIGAVQEVIYAHISPALQGAIDQKAEIDLAIDHFANSIALDRPSLHELLGEALTGVVSRKVLGLDQIVDLLTLMDLGQDSATAQNDFYGREFYLALRVVRVGLYNNGDPNYILALQKLVWRRCIIEDDWDATGRAAEQMGSESESLLYTTSLFRTLVLCLKDRLAEDGNIPPLYLPASPEEVLLNDSESALLLSRFRPEQRVRITHDLEHENSILTKYMETGELGFWFKNLLGSAEKVTTTSIDTENLHHPVSESELNERHPNQTGNFLRKERLNWL